MGAVCLVAAGCFSSISTQGVKLYTNIGAVFLLVTNLAVVVILLSVAPVHQTADFVFGTFNTQDAATSGLPSVGCVLLVTIAPARSPVYACAVVHFFYHTQVCVLQELQARLCSILCWLGM